MSGIDPLFLVGTASVPIYNAPMKPTRSLSLAAAAALMLAIVSVTAGAGEYRGKVGKLPAVFSLDWSADGTVTGTYSHPSRPGKTYRLLGNNAEAGKLYLEEYTGSTLSAKCYLAKKLTDGAIVWSGEMRNTDGRVLAMELSRSRESTRSPSAAAETSAAIPAGGVYYGETGGALTEISLEWGEGGAVTGTCLYPSRPGKVYRLSGRNPAEGKLDLEERLDDTVTARASLKKRITYDEVVWEGRLAAADGREVPVWFARQRKPEAENMEQWADEQAFYGQLERDSVWDAFPDSRKPLDKVPVNWDYSHKRFPGKITQFESRSGSTLLKIQVGVGWSQPDFSGPEITLQYGRSLPLPPEQLIGKSVSLVYSGTGALQEVNLHSIAMTHWRKGSDGLVEIRGVLGSRLLDELDLLTPAEKAALLTAMAPVSFIPDKFATDPDVALDFPFREIRLLAQYGTVVQTTGAGPGGLELESISLEKPPPSENPWIYVGDRDPITEMPRFQWTEEAG
jgi:hypothetical protein